ncbi:MAG: hypothetical protein PHR94_10785, partial [Methylomonas lenta]|nr:hypothetical protein [Methylomonas lenta]
AVKEKLVLADNLSDFKVQAGGFYGGFYFRWQCARVNDGADERGDGEAEFGSFCGQESSGCAKNAGRGCFKVNRDGW